MYRHISIVALDGAIAAMSAYAKTIAENERYVYDELFPQPQAAAVPPKSRVESFWISHSTGEVTKCIGPSTGSTDRIASGNLSENDQYHGGNDQSYPPPTWLHQSKSDVACAKAHCDAPHPNDWGCSATVSMTATEYFKPILQESPIRQFGYQTVVVMTFLIPVVSWVWALFSNFRARRS
jgi:hypothetical protein